MWIGEYVHSVDFVDDCEYSNQALISYIKLWCLYLLDYDDVEFINHVKLNYVNHFIWFYI